MSPPFDEDDDGDAVITAHRPRRPTRPLSQPGPPIQVLDEATARAVLRAEFAAAGYTLREPYPFQQAGIMTTLDAYDEAARVGYTFISHHGDDVITDLDEADELGLAHLAEDGRAHIMVVHDRDVPDAATLTARAQAFLASLPRR
jgi:hypothetical protein